jgi:two-component system, NarL family, sensor kinase
MDSGVRSRQLTWSSLKSQLIKNKNTIRVVLKTLFLFLSPLMDQDAYNFLIIFSIASVGMLGLAGSIILFVVFYQKKMIQEQMKRQAMQYEFQQKMLQAELESQETERRRLSADLHDSIGGMLSTIRVGLSTMARQLPDPHSMEETKKMLDDTITSVRRISRDLMPSTLEKFGLVQALKELCERFQATSTIRVVFHEEGNVSEVDKNRSLMVFRIVQELLNNAVKHSRAEEIRVTLDFAQELSAVVEDNGVGFDADAVINDKQSGRGLGLFNIENRARLLGGTISYGKVNPTGSKTTVTIPL